MSSMLVAFPFVMFVLATCNYISICLATSSHAKQVFSDEILVGIWNLPPNIEAANYGKFDCQWNQQSIYNRAPTV